MLGIGPELGDNKKEFDREKGFQDNYEKDEETSDGRKRKKKNKKERSKRKIKKRSNFDDASSFFEDKSIIEGSSFLIFSIHPQVIFSFSNFQ
jgi:hypothetical protein